MSKIIKIIITTLSIILLIILAILIVGAIKFNFSDSDVIMPGDDRYVSTTTEIVIDKPIVATTSTTTLSINKTTLDLTSKIWKWSDSQNKNYEKFSLNFKKDKTVSITTDCNGMGGNYTQKGNDLIFTQMISTMMFCEDSSEQEFSQKIQSVKSFKIEDGKLILIYDKGVLNFK